MAASISILGNTGREVELRYTPQGLPVASFSLASNSVRNTAEGKQKKTDWFNVTAFGKVAETLARNLKKGSPILVQGKLTFNPWLSRSGEPRVGADVVMQDFEFTGGMPPAARSMTDGEEGQSSDAEVQMAAPSGAGPIPSEMIQAAGTHAAAAEPGEPFAGQF